MHSGAGLTAAGGRHYLVGLIVAASAYYILAFVFLSGARLQYPYEVDYTEGAHVAVMARLAQGQAIYAAPDIHYTALSYTPLYFYAANLLASTVPAFGAGDYWALRLVTILATLGTALIILTIARRHQAPLWIGVAAVGMFLGAFARCGCIQDTAHVDGLAVALAVAGMYFLFEGRQSMRTAAFGGMLAGLGFMTKQTMVVFVVVPTAWLMLSRLWSRAFLFSAAALVTVIGLLWHWRMLFNPWFYFIVFKVHATAHLNLDRLFFYAPWFLILVLPAGLLVGVLGNAWPGAGWRNAVKRCLEDPWAVVMAGVVAMSLVAKAKDGGGENVFLPVVALGAVQMGRHAHRLMDKGSKQLTVLLALQMAVLVYLPAQFWPTAADREYGDRLVEQIKRIPGDVYVPAFPEYATRAGKPWYVHYTVACDHSNFDKTLRNALGQAIRAQKFSAILPRTDVEKQDLGICDLPNLEDYYMPAEPVTMPPRPSLGDILTGHPSIVGMVHGEKFSYLYVPRKSQLNPSDGR